jgi:hypothetical protein
LVLTRGMVLKTNRVLQEFLPRVFDLGFESVRAFGLPPGGAVLWLEIAIESATS